MDAMFPFINHSYIILPFFSLHCKEESPLFPLFPPEDEGPRPGGKGRFFCIFCCTEKENVVYYKPV